MLTPIQKLKIQEETRRDFYDADSSVLKILIFLTLCLRSLHTKTAIFLALAIATYTIAFSFYCKGASPIIFMFTAIIHIIVTEITTAWYKKDGLANDYEGLDTMYKELKAILLEKKPDINSGGKG